MATLNAPNTEFYDDSLTVTINDTEFTVNAPSASEGMRLRMLFANKLEGLNEFAEITKLFGGEIGDDGVPTGGLWAAFDEHNVSPNIAHHFGVAALYYWGIGPTMALEYWERMGKLGEPEPEPVKKTPAKKTTS